MLTLRQEQERCDSERSFVQAGKCLSTVVKCSDLKVLSENMHRGGEIKKEKEEDWPGIKQLRRRQIRQSAERKKKKSLCAARDEFTVHESAYRSLVLRTVHSKLQHC